MLTEDRLSRPIERPRLSDMGAPNPNQTFGPTMGPM